MVTSMELDGRLQEQGVTWADVEDRLSQLMAQIPAEFDPQLDKVRRSEFGDSSYRSLLNRQVRAFSIYSSYLRDAKKVLDWGCRHALDSCMARMINPEIELHGCDITPSIADVMGNFAGLQYKPLNHPWQLPYEDASFDLIIASGVLEHVPIQGASLKELNRICRPGGYLAVTFLPNKWSYTEFASRNIFKQGFHRRLYTRSRIKTLMLEHGFEPVEVGHHQVLPSLTSGHASIKSPLLRKAFRATFKADPVVEKIWPIKLMAANIYAIGRRRDYI